MWLQDTVRRYAAGMTYAEPYVRDKEVLYMYHKASGQRLSGSSSVRLTAFVFVDSSLFFSLLLLCLFT